MTKKKEKKTLRIIRLIAENFKRVRAVDIKPTAKGLVVITGRNGQGKTSTLDAMWLAIGGGKASKDVEKVIRKGEEMAVAQVDLGGLTITRTWKPDKNGKIVSTIKVIDSNGNEPDKPQTALDTLYDLVAFDPSAFAAMTPAQQVAELLRACGEEDTLKELDEKRLDCFEKRTDQNRTAKENRAEADKLPDYGDEVPDAEYSTAEIVEFIDIARRHAAENERRTQAHIDAIENYDKSITASKEAEQAAIDAALECERLHTIAHQAEQLVTEMTEPADIEELKAKGDDLDTLNQKVRDKKRRAGLVDALEKAEALAEKLTDDIEEIDARKRSIISGSKLPVEGLDFGPDGVTHDGIPFADCAESLKLRISMGLAMALNPDLRVIRITSGSALDSDSMKLFEEMAQDRDFQVWVERVDDTSEDVIVIEDGAVVGAEVADAAPKTFAEITGKS